MSRNNAGKDLSVLLKAQWDRAIAVGCIVAAVVVLILGYIGISDTPYVAEQLPYFISAGVVAIVLCAVAGMMWVSADLRDEWRELGALRQQLAAENAAPEVTAGR